MRKGRDGEKNGMEWKMENEMENNGGNSGHYVIASRPPNGDRLQRLPLVPIMEIVATIVIASQPPNGDRLQR